MFVSTLVALDFTLSPPVEREKSLLMTDSDNTTCLALVDTELFRSGGAASFWSPRPKEECWMPGLSMSLDLEEKANASKIITITGHDLVCSVSHFEVDMLETEGTGCGIAGVYSICKWHDAIENDGLVTCAADCACVGSACQHLNIYFPRLPGVLWDICEIRISDKLYQDIDPTTVSGSGG